MIPIGGIGANPNPNYNLPPLNVNPDLITASGFSSGAYMSNQIHVAFSERIKGAGFGSGGCYANGKWARELRSANIPKGKRAVTKAKYLTYSLKVAKDNAAAGTIDPLSGIKNAPVYIWGGM